MVSSKQRSTNGSLLLAGIFATGTLSYRFFTNAWYKRREEQAEERVVDVRIRQAELRAAAQRAEMESEQVRANQQELQQPNPHLQAMVGQGASN